MQYPWYELIEDCNEITQGDIIKKCPVPIIKADSEIKAGNTIEADIKIIDGIVLTQACDIANKKVDNIIMCSITSKEIFEKEQIKAGKNQKEINRSLDSIIKGQQNAYHIINNYKTEEFQQDYYIINFKDIFSIPVELAKEIALQSGKRLRLCPPYREHLSQAFARYFMRVGLPININLE